MTRVATWCAAALLACAMCACTGDGDDPSVAEGQSDVAPQTVIALGGNTTQAEDVENRLYDAWPYRMFRDAFARTAVFVNAAVEGATAERVRETQLPIVRELAPDIVVMWIGAADLRTFTPTSEFARSLSRLVTAVQSAGADRVLVGNLPKAYGGDVASYNDAIQHVVRETGAELVELDSQRVVLVDNGRTEPQIDIASHRAVADAFGRRIATG